jgi:hypothetical protein
LAKASTLSPRAPKSELALLTSALSSSVNSYSSPLIRIFEHLVKTLSGAPLKKRLRLLSVPPAVSVDMSLMKALNLISDEKGIRHSVSFPASFLYKWVGNYALVLSRSITPWAN